MELMDTDEYIQNQNTIPTNVLLQSNVFSITGRGTVSCHDRGVVRVNDEIEIVVSKEKSKKQLLQVLKCSVNNLTVLQGITLVLCFFGIQR